MSPSSCKIGPSSSLPPPWIELPRDVTENILRRLWQLEILGNARKVCTTWRSVCSESFFWRVIDMKYSNDIMYRRAIDLSQGELIDISIEHFSTDDLLRYIYQRSSHLKRLELRSYDISVEGLIASVKNFLELEQLHLILMSFITTKDIEDIGTSCPKLKSFTFSVYGYMFEEIDESYALTIAKNMPNLNQLCLVGNMLSNEGLKAIFDGCPNLESLDLRQCYNVNLQGDFGKICIDRIKNLKLPFDSIGDIDGWASMVYDDVQDQNWNNLFQFLISRSL